MSRAGPDQFSLCCVREVCTLWDRTRVKIKQSLTFECFRDSFYTEDLHSYFCILNIVKLYIVNKSAKCFSNIFLLKLLQL